MKNIIKKISIDRYFFLTVIFTLGLVAVGFRMWKYDYLQYPIVYTHDGLDFIKNVKNIIDTHSYWGENAHIGAPFSSRSAVDFPFADNFVFLIVTLLIQIFGPNPFLVSNIYILLTFVLTSVISYITLKHLGLNSKNASYGAIVFAFLPYHFVRITVGHIFLASYFGVPLTCLLCFKLVDKNFTFSSYIQPKILFLLFIMIGIISSTGSAYYAVFSIFLILCSGIINVLWHQNKFALFGSVTVSLAILLGLIINLYPAISYQVTNGKSSVVMRDPKQIEEFGLRLSRMLVPLPSTIIPGIRQTLTDYYKNVQHEQYQYIGIIGVLGFFYLIYVLIVDKSYSFEKSASLLSAAALMLGSSGGIAYMVGYLGMSQLRAYNRLSVFIAFITILCIYKLFQRLEKRLFIKGKIAVFVLTAVTIVDQLAYAQPHELFWKSKDVFANDRKFVKMIESTLPKEAMVYQLPYIQYPENPQECSLDSYDLFRAYLHSNSLRWSFGSVKGRLTAAWHEYISLLPTEKMLQQILFAGFDAIYIDRTGCLDVNKLQDEILKITHANVTLSDDARLVFIDLQGYKQKLQAGMTESDWQKNHDNTIKQLLFAFKTKKPKSSYSLNGLTYELNSNTEIQLVNQTMQPQLFSIEMTVNTNKTDTIPFEVQYADVSASFHLIDKQLFQHTLTAIPGTSVVKLVGASENTPIKITNLLIDTK